MQLCVAVHRHEYGVDAKLFYIPEKDNSLLGEETIAEKLGFDVDEGYEDFIISIVDNVPNSSQQLAGIPVIS